MFLPRPEEKPPPPSDDDIFEKLRELNTHRKIALATDPQSETYHDHDRAFQICQIWFEENQIPIYFHKDTDRWHLGTRAG